jgi:hypothetical protein
MLFLDISFCVKDIPAVVDEEIAAQLPSELLHALPECSGAIESVRVISSAKSIQPTRAKRLASRVRAAIGHVAAAPLSNLMKSRRVMGHPLRPRTRLYHIIA